MILASRSRSLGLPRAPASCRASAILPGQTDSLGGRVEGGVSRSTRLAQASPRECWSRDSCRCPRAHRWGHRMLRFCRVPVEIRRVAGLQSLGVAATHLFDWRGQRNVVELNEWPSTEAVPWPYAETIPSRHWWRESLPKITLRHASGSGLRGQKVDTRANRRFVAVALSRSLKEMWSSKARVAPQRSDYGTTLHTGKGPFVGCPCSSCQAPNSLARIFVI